MNRILNKILCSMWGHNYFSHVRLYISDDEWINEIFKCKHCGAHKHD